ncbi:MAG: hypothetical protein KAH32_06795 [Chlamydiia bacterium]|nr:hypothetical protein [Chlamydiia bacterium]
MNITKIFLSTSPVREKLKFGINENVVLRSVSNETRRTKDGVKSTRFCFTKFSEVDVETRKIVAEYEFSHNKSTNPDWALKNTMHLYNQIQFIVKAVVPKEKKKAVLASISKAVNDTSYETTMNKLIKSPATMGDKDFNKLFEYSMGISKAFEAEIAPYVGVNSELLKLLVVTGQDIKYLELPREENNTVFKMTDKKELEVPSYYIKKSRGKKGAKESGDKKANTPLNLAAISGGSDAMAGLEGM